MNTEDMFGRTVEEGDRVIYTTSVERSGLYYAKVERIYQNGTHKKVRLQPLNADGSYETVTVKEWDRSDGYGNWKLISEHDTGKKVRPSIVDANPARLYRIGGDV